jgi:hypothetical protein
MTKNNNGDVGEKGPLYTIGGNANWYSHYGKQYGGFSKNLKLKYHVIQL